MDIRLPPASQDTNDTGLQAWQMDGVVQISFRHQAPEGCGETSPYSGP
jgi:hypothetical protein